MRLCYRQEKVGRAWLCRRHCRRPIREHPRRSHGLHPRCAPDAAGAVSEGEPLASGAGDDSLPAPPLGAVLTARQGRTGPTPRVDCDIVTRFDSLQRIGSRPTASRSSLARNVCRYISLLRLRPPPSPLPLPAFESPAHPPMSFTTLSGLSDATGGFVFDPAAAQYPASSPFSGSGSSDRPGSSASSPGPEPLSERPQPGPSRTQLAVSTTRRRVRAKIDLAPDQPPTARGNPRIRVFVACYQW